MVRRLARTLSIVLLVLMLAVSPLVVSAAYSTTADTSYSGGQSSADQAIQVTYSLSPEGGTINNMTIGFDATSNTFLQSDSFSITVSPGSADADVESMGNDRFFIDELDTDEEITFVFEVYPKTIKNEEIEAVTVRTEYIQNGQELSNSETVSANLSSSPWFQLQAAEENNSQLENRVAELEGRVEQLVLVDQLTDAMLWVGIVVGLLGLGIGIYFNRKAARNAAELRDDHADKVENLARRMDSQLDENRVEDLADEIREESSIDEDPW